MIATCASFCCSISASARTTWPRTFAAKIVVAPSLVSACGVEPPVPPAFITSASTGSASVDAARRTEVRSAVSSTTTSNTERPVSTASARRASPARCSLRQAKRTRSIVGREPSWRASSRPIPAFAPVMSTDLTDASLKALPSSEMLHA
jgi:hypothetical protein